MSRPLRAWGSVHGQEREQVTHGPGEDRNVPLGVWAAQLSEWTGWGWGADSESLWLSVSPPPPLCGPNWESCLGGGPRAKDRGESRDRHDPSQGGTALTTVFPNCQADKQTWQEA